MVVVVVTVTGCGAKFSIPTANDDTITYGKDWVYTMYGATNNITNTGNETADIQYYDDGIDSFLEIIYTGITKDDVFQYTKTLLDHGFGVAGISGNITKQFIKDHSDEFGIFDYSVDVTELLNQNVVGVYNINQDSFILKFGRDLVTKNGDYFVITIHYSATKCTIDYQIRDNNTITSDTEMGLIPND